MGVITIADVVGLNRYPGVVVSRATWFTEGFGDVPVHQLPLISGRTVWAVSAREEWLHVIEQPNYFGRFETRLPSARAVTTVRRWAGARDAGAVVDVDVEVPRDAVRTAQGLAGRLLQIPGVKLPHGRAESPWFVVGLPSDPKKVSQVLLQEGFGACTPLGVEYAEFPGGLRIEVAWPTKDNERFAQLVETAIEV